MQVDLLSRVHSPYLLELIGYCADKGHRLLVYEYMANGSLEQHLYSDGKTLYYTCLSEVLSCVYMGLYGHLHVDDFVYRFSNQARAKSPCIWMLFSME